MTTPKPKFREIVFLLLYILEEGHCEEKDAINLVQSVAKVSKTSALEALINVQKILAAQKKIDSLVQKASTEYSLERIHKVALNILRLALFEVLYGEGISPRLAISEAIRLAKKFSTDESSAFIHALVDRIYREEKGV